MLAPLLKQMCISMNLQAQKAWVIQKNDEDDRITMLELYIILLDDMS